MNIKQIEVFLFFIKYFLILIPIKQNKDSYKINIFFFKNIFPR